MTTCRNSKFLQDVIAYVDVWSSNKTENYSKPFILQLEEMGAQVSKTFTKQVTHVVFQHGHEATWNKAKRTDVKLVSVLWVARCEDDGGHVDENLYPANNDYSSPALKKKRHRCMQSRDNSERTPQNDHRMRKKLDQMKEDLIPTSPVFTDISPYIIDEANGIVYSPSMKWGDYMAKRLTEMKEKRENLSSSDDESESCTAIGGRSCHSLEQRVEDHDHSTDLTQSASLHNKEPSKPWMSPCNDLPRHRSPILSQSPDLHRKDQGTKPSKKHQKSLENEDPVKKCIFPDSLDSPFHQDILNMPDAAMRGKPTEFFPHEKRFAKRKRKHSGTAGCESSLAKRGRVGILTNCSTVQTVTTPPCEVGTVNHASSAREQPHRSTRESIGTRSRLQTSLPLRT